MCNGAAAGSSQGGNGIGDGTWDVTATNTVWNPVADGTGTPIAWTAGDHAVFSAGSDVGTDPSIAGGFVTTTAGLTPASLTIEEGFIDFAGSAIAMGSNPILIKQGATLSIPNQNMITANLGQIVTIDGGTISNHVIGVGSTFYNAPGRHATGNSLPMAPRSILPMAALRPAHGRPHQWRLQHHAVRLRLWPLHHRVRTQARYRVHSPKPATASSAPLKTGA